LSLMSEVLLPSKPPTSPKEEAPLEGGLRAGQTRVIELKHIWGYNPVCKVIPVILHGVIDLGIHPLVG